MDHESYDRYSSNRVKHLDMIQTVITRLGNNGFIVKGWAITVSGAFIGFGISRENGWLVSAGSLPAALFWFLDATFLRAERAYRTLFGRVRSGDAVPPFEMGATSPRFLRELDQREKDHVAWATVLRRPSLVLLYGTVIATAMAIAVLLAIWGKPAAPVQGS